MSTAATTLNTLRALDTDRVEQLPQRPIVFFDGVCGMCNASVDFLMRHDRRECLMFAPLQGVTAEQLLTVADRTQLSSLILWTPQQQYRYSSATVRILWLLGGVWYWLGWLLWLIPLPVRNLGYRVVARYRYRLAGKKETCRMPTPAERARFLP